MDLDSIEALNEVQTSVYRAALKLQSVQRLTHLHVVSVRHVAATLRSIGGARDIGKQEVVQLLNRMFVSVSQEMPGHVSVEAPEEMSSAIFTLFDKDGTVDVDSLQTFLVAMCADSLSEKYLALVSLAASGTSPIPGSVNRSSLRTLLHNLSMLPKLVQEEGVFGSVEAAVKSCFKSILSPSVSRDHVISWLHAEPRLTLWLPTMYRLNVSQNITHDVRCHCCKSRPFTGLRFRCEKCVGVQLCQTCFFTNRSSRKHKQHHPMMEFCGTPTFKESVSSLVQNARHALRFKQSRRRRRQLAMESQQNPRSSTEDRLDVAHNAPVSPSQQTDQSPALERSDSAQQTDWAVDLSEREALKDELRTLQQDKCILEEQLEALRQTVQSEHSVLEDKYSQVEVTVETLRRHHSMLESFVTQALEKIESQRTNDTTEDELEEEEDNEETEEEEEEELKLLEADEDDVTPPPTVLCGSALSHNLYVEEEEPGLCSSPPPPVQEQQQQEAEDCGSCSSEPEEKLLDAVQGLKLALERDTWNKTEQGSDKKWEELLEAADEVAEEIHQLVDALV